MYRCCSAFNAKGIKAMRIKVIGYSHLTGVSHKSGSPKAYDIPRILVLHPLQDQSRENYNRVCDGFEGIELACKPEVFAKLKGKSFPIECNLVTEQSIDFGKLLSTVVDVEFVK